MSLPNRSLSCHRTKTDPLHPDITPPRFHIGHGTILGWLGLSILCTAFAMWDYRRLNRAKEAQCKAEGIDESRWEEFVEMGSESPLFRYTL